MSSRYMNQKHEILCTVGPSSLNKKFIKYAETVGVSLLRINLSHTSAEVLPQFIRTIKSMTNLPICIDSEGAQIRTSNILGGSIEVRENSFLKISSKRVPGNSFCINLHPLEIVNELRQGDFISIDFNSVMAQVFSVDEDGATLRILIGGKVGQNKAVTVEREIALPPFTDRDYECFEIGKKFGIEHYALSFAHSKEDVNALRKIVGTNAKIISKIECRAGLENLVEIANASNAILIDRGDLSREVNIAKIAAVQKEIIKITKQTKAKVYVATNLLESMIDLPAPTRAEVNDIYNTLYDGADGLVLAAETAIGKHPEKAIEMVAKIIHEFEKEEKDLLQHLGNYFRPTISYLCTPHGGTLVQQYGNEEDILNAKKEIIISTETALDCEQIADGTYSPVTGFFKRDELASVLNEYRLLSGDIWTMPIVLQVDKDVASTLKKGDRVLLKVNNSDNVHSYIDIEDLYELDLESIALKWFGTNSNQHPGVSAFMQKGRWAIGGKVFLLNKQDSELKEYSFSPAQSRFIFEKKGWRNIVGFHTRNVPHRVHEYIQKLALENTNADGLYLTPIIGPKKKGDFLSAPVLQSYQSLIDFGHYPYGKVMLGTFQSYPRYCGPREAVFTALCRKNMGCNYFIIGRDHTGVGDFYSKDANEKLFKQLGDIGIMPLFFDEYCYCKDHDSFMPSNKATNPQLISGTQVRESLKASQAIPFWFMRDIVQNTLKDLIGSKTEIFF